MKRFIIHAGLVLFVLAAVAPTARAVAAEQKEAPALKAEFLKMCDAACAELNTPERKVPFYQDSYAVRALAVAYDLTADRRYLDVCRAWSDKMLEYQSGMTPKGAFWMHYGRKPGETQGEWFVADCASISMGILATAARCPKPADRSRYLNSVKAYAKLVMDSFVKPTGGVTDGFWSQFDGEWWCSTGLFGSLAFLLYSETKDRPYLNVGLRAVGWLDRTTFRKAKYLGFDMAPASVVMYTFEAVAAGLPYIDLEGPLGKATTEQVADVREWMSQNQCGRIPDCHIDYNSQWGSKLGGLPFLQYVFSRYLPDGAVIAAAADKELDYVGRLIFSASEPKLTQLVCFAMMSYADKLAPGAIYRKAKG